MLNEAETKIKEKTLALDNRVKELRKSITESAEETLQALETAAATSSNEVKRARQKISQVAGLQGRGGPQA